MTDNAVEEIKDKLDDIKKWAGINLMILIILITINFVFVALSHIGQNDKLDRVQQQCAPR